MIIDKVINNNVVTAVDKNGNEVVLMGKGIGFGIKSGQSIDAERIEKKYVMDSHADVNRFEEVVKSIPMEHLDVSMDIISYAKEVLNNRLSSSIYISLTDHINFALERYHSGVMFENPLLNEVRNFYPREYLVGEYAIALIQKRMKILLPMDEVGSIALHFVNASPGVCMFPSHLGEGHFRFRDPLRFGEDRFGAISDIVGRIPVSAKIIIYCCHGVTIRFTATHKSGSNRHFFFCANVGLACGHEPWLAWVIEQKSIICFCHWLPQKISFGISSFVTRALRASVSEWERLQ